VISTRQAEAIREAARREAAAAPPLSDEVRERIRRALMPIVTGEQGSREGAA
jgi:hypothetical protein